MKGFAMFGNETISQVPEDPRPGESAWNMAALCATPLRWVTGWLFFSAFWRRVVLEPGKLDPNAAAYVGHEFVKFLPHAIGIKPFLAIALAHDGMLQGFMICFTVIEGLVGLALLLGLGTRLAALGTVLGILLGSGWLGSTCLDEWQIGVLGVAAGTLLAMTGSGAWSLDRFWQNRFRSRAPKAWLIGLSSGAPKAGQPRWFRPAALVLASGSLVLTLATNQIFYGGLWGRLHNDSKTPHFALTNGRITAAGSVRFTLYRDGGPDTYGAFITTIRVRNAASEIVEQFDPGALKMLPPGSVRNTYALKVGPGPYGLIAPLGSKAILDLVPGRASTLPEGSYTIEVEDVSGLKWHAPAGWSM
jgi:thiosulfate dehydrogenase [quinone] large subunit